MHVRTNTVKGKNKTYTYTQIVKSYRNSRGTPATKVFASFSNLPKVVEDNLRLALAAARDGLPVIVAEQVAKEIAVPKCSHNLEYLDLAVLRQIWQRRGIDKILNALVPSEQAEVRIVDVIEALALQRCVAPGSKLSAERWYPGTALPEIHGIQSSQMNNTRIHRVLCTLDSIGDKLQSKLPSQLEAQHGSFVWLALDLSNTWFVGPGPPMSRKAKTKEGLLRQRVGIALMCEHRGLPLRWKTLQGNYHEGTEMTVMLKATRNLDWVGERLVIVDRAMGSWKTVEWMHEEDIRFLTAVRVNEFDSYTDRIPWQSFDELKVAGIEASEKDDIKRICRVARRAGLMQVDEDCYLLDLGVITKVSPKRQSAPPTPGNSRAALALTKALEMQADQEQGMRRLDVAKKHGVSRNQVTNLRRLVSLRRDLQQRVLAGEADGVLIGLLERVARMPEPKQLAAFDALLARSGAVALNASTRSNKPHEDAAQAVHAVPVRVVIVFNPNRFLEQRRNEVGRFREIDAFIDDLNRRLRTPLSRRTESSILREVERKLRVLNLHSVFDVEVALDASTDCGHQVVLKRNDNAWQKQRRYDGFHLFVAHPKLTHSAAELVELYYAKNEVERDFQTIKSVLGLRPVRHRQDPKVRAHVTLCMLSLLLERSLEIELRHNRLHLSAPKALEILKRCHLNRFMLGSEPAYSVTEPEEAAMDILQALGMEDLVNDEVVARSINPR